MDWDDLPSEHSHEVTQWVAAGANTFDALGAAEHAIGKAMSELGELPEILYDKAPDAWAEEALRLITTVRGWAEWSSRLIIETSNIPQRKASELSGIAPSTVNRWRADPMTTDDGSFGPGAGREHDRRRKRARNTARDVRGTS